MKYRHSILVKDFELCFFCRRPAEAVHHIYNNNWRRKISEREGFLVPLCNNCHNLSLFSVHLDPDKEKDIFLKRICQKKYEESHTREEFIKLCGRNYLD